MIKIKLNDNKYHTCISCDSKGKQYSVMIGREGNNSTLITLCDDCLRYLSNSAKDILKES